MKPRERTIERARVDHLSLPLAEPYRLSIGSVEAYDVVLVRLWTDGGSVGVGETVPLAGYSSHSLEEVWSATTEAVQSLPGTSVGSALDRIGPGLHSFARAGVVTALEDLYRADPEALTAPVVGTVSTAEPTDEAVLQLRTYLETGYRTIKIKVGFDVDAEVRRLRELVDVTPTDRSIRVDANQGYDYEAAERFIAETADLNLQLIEQLLPTDRFADHARLRADSSTPIMLDEDIVTADDVERAIEAEAADILKFKLMKQGGIDRTREQLRLAREAGLGVVLGNGVQTGISCVREAALWHEADLQLAGEFNGWQKLERPLVAEGLTRSEDALVWAGGPIALDETVLTESRVRGHAVE